MASVRNGDRPGSPMPGRVAVLALAITVAATAVPAAFAYPADAAPRPRIVVLATGGTIAGSSDPRSAGGYNAATVTGAQLLRSVAGIDRLARLSTEQVANVASQDMTDAIWLRLARRIEALFARGDTDAVVVTHGTDTMEETAFFLDNVLHTDKPVVLVGAMRPGDAISPDGPGNLFEAVEVAASPGAAGRRVMVVMNDQIHAPRRVTKSDTTAVQTFRSPDGGPIGFVDAARVRFVSSSPPRSRTYALPASGDLPRVEIVFAHSNMDGGQIDDAIRRHARGIVLAGEGDGNASEAALAALDRAVKAGIVVVRSTRVFSGFVNRNVEVDDDRRGFVTSYDLNPEKARVLVQLLVQNGITSPARVQAAFDATI